jgi:hypothetical protein
MILPRLAQHGQRAVATFGAHGGDVCAERGGDPQAVQRQQGHQRVVVRRTESGGDEQGAEFVGVQRGRVGFVVQPRSVYVRRR